VSRALDVVTLTGEEYDAMQEAIERLRELADSEGTRAVEYLRRARKAEADVAHLMLAEEGAKEAFGHVVQQKRDLEEECIRLRSLLHGAYEINRRREAAQSVDFLLGGTRLKLSFQQEECESCGAASTHFRTVPMDQYAEELQGRWVALVPAENDVHLKMQKMTPNAGGNATERSEGRVDHNVGRQF